MVKIGRNDPCPCGSGRKYKKCCQSLNERIQKITGSTNPHIPLQAFAEGNSIDTPLAQAYFATDTINLLTWKNTELILLKNLTEMIKAIDLCISKKYFNSALKLMYTAIDNMAYLGTDYQKTSKSVFIKWVNSFLLPSSNLSCSAEELYAERCTLLHQNTASASNISLGIKSILYTLGTARPENGLDHVDESKRNQYKFISISSLREVIYQGILKFLESASKYPSQKERLLRRASMYFANIDDEIA